MRGNCRSDLRYSTSNGVGLFVSSPSDLSSSSQWTPQAMQAINIDDHKAVARSDNANDSFSCHTSFKSAMEGTLSNPYDCGSTSSTSNSFESEFTSKPCLSSDHNSSSRHFMSKPIHPFAFPTRTPREASGSAAAGSSKFHITTPQMEATEVSRTHAREIFSQSRNSPVGFRCGLCEKFLSQRSPWSSRRMIRTEDMPVASVLSCHHVFHAECLDQTTPRTCKDDPPCPICHRLEEDCSEHKKIPRLSEVGQSRSWGCIQVGDCVEGALHVPPRNTMLSLNRSRMKRNLSLRGTAAATKEFPGKLRKSSSFYSQRSSGMSTGKGPVGCSNSASAPGMKKL